MPPASDSEVADLRRLYLIRRRLLRKQPAWFARPVNELTFDQRATVLTWSANFRGVERKILGIVLSRKRPPRIGSMLLWPTRDLLHFVAVDRFTHKPNTTEAWARFFNRILWDYTGGSPCDRFKAST